VDASSGVNLGRVLVVLGVAAVIIGLLIMYVPAFRPGRLPGDISFPLGQNGRVYFPIGTSIALSVLLTLIFALLNRR
jgi:Protein of unknown function (DUF2905)